ncbi:MAG: cytochrome P460 family protein [bacterium]|nr:cytochrome P460 family protein [bacterium]
MKKYMLGLLLILVLGVQLAVFSADIGLSHGMDAKTKEGKSYYCLIMDRPRPSAGDVRYFITKCGTYTNWEMWPGKEKLYAGKEPHGSFLTLYVNKIALDSLTEKKDMQDGAMIVKENYSADKKLMAITVMYKVKGFDPAAGDWLWIKYDPAFEILAEGKVKECIDCHSKAKNADYIMTEKIKP